MPCDGKEQNIRTPGNSSFFSALCLSLFMKRYNVIDTPCPIGDNTDSTRSNFVKYWEEFGEFDVPGVSPLHLLRFSPGEPKSATASVCNLHKTRFWGLGWNHQRRNIPNPESGRCCRLRFPENIRFSGGSVNFSAR